MALDRKLAMFMKWMGWMRSPDGASIIWSSSATLRQLKPSAANSMVLRAALWCSSLAEHHRRSRWRYSPRVGMSMTATSLWRKTLRLDFVLCDNELQLVCEASVPSDPCNNKDAMKWECEQTEEQNKDCQQLSLASAGASLPKRFPCSPPSEWGKVDQKKLSASRRIKLLLCVRHASSTRWPLKVSQTAESNTQIHKKGILCTPVFLQAALIM